jgi:hypothetical protein
MSSIAVLPSEAGWPSAIGIEAPLGSLSTNERIKQEKNRVDISQKAYRRK